MIMDTHNLSVINKCLRYSLSRWLLSLQLLLFWSYNPHFSKHLHQFLLFGHCFLGFFSLRFLLEFLYGVHLDCLVTIKLWFLVVLRICSTFSFVKRSTSCIKLYSSLFDNHSWTWGISIFLGLLTIFLFQCFVNNLITSNFPGIIDTLTSLVLIKRCSPSQEGLHFFGKLWFSIRPSSADLLWTFS